ncbi:MAG: hypothetical protein LBI69_02295 [Puniceicoccales bacterium]|jgi:hypothetical protein|nr:hypothetical protein [Puniceicoccales bacterium]
MNASEQPVAAQGGTQRIDEIEKKSIELKMYTRRATGFKVLAIVITVTFVLLSIAAVLLYVSSTLATEFIFSGIFLNSMHWLLPLLFAMCCLSVIFHYVNSMVRDSLQETIECLGSQSNSNTPR